MTREIVTDRYAKLSITLHWLMLALFVGVYACIEIKGLLPRGSNARALFLGLHGLFGISIFALVWVRLLGRLTPRPPITPTPPAWHDAPGAVWLDDCDATDGLVDAGCGRQALAVFRLLSVGTGVGGSGSGQAIQVLARMAWHQRLLADRPACVRWPVPSLLGR